MADMKKVQLLTCILFFLQEWANICFPCTSLTQPKGILLTSAIDILNLNELANTTFSTLHCSVVVEDDKSEAATFMEKNCFQKFKTLLEKKICFQNPKLNQAFCIVYLKVGVIFDKF